MELLLIHGFFFPNPNRSRFLKKITPHSIESGVSKFQFSGILQRQNPQDRWMGQFIDPLGTSLITEGIYDPSIGMRLECVKTIVPGGTPARIAFKLAVKSIFIGNYNLGRDKDLPARCVINVASPHLLKIMSS